MTCFCRLWRNVLVSFGILGLGAIGFWAMADAPETKAKAAPPHKPPPKQSFLDKLRRNNEQQNEKV